MRSVNQRAGSSSAPPVVAVRGAQARQREASNNDRRGSRIKIHGGHRPPLQWVIAIVAVCLLGTTTARAQTAEEVFKNVQVLKGIPVDQFMDTMGFFSASLALNCTSCHGVESASDAAKFADDTPLKKTARRMILMVRAINKDNFGGAGLVTCYSCHRGGERPKITPSLADQYGIPPEGDPNEFEASAQTPGAPSAAEVFAKYIQAIGGAQQVARLNSIVAKGTYEGYDTDRTAFPVEIYSKAPDQHATIVHIRGGDKISTYDGRAGWILEPLTPAPLMALTGGALDGARIDAMLPFPPRIQQSRSQWRVGTTMIEDTEVLVAEGTGPGQAPIKLFFDKNSGLLVRMVRYSNTVVGPVPTQVDFSDYRDVSGVKLPFKWTTTWVDGQSTTQLSEVQTNVSIDATRFAKPTR
jgi:photosynthetic reaction center cytochrome c subunit